MTARSHAVPILQLFALTVMIIPSDTVIQAIGASGYPAGLVGLFAFATFIAATLLGFHDPLRNRHPVRSVLCLFWVSLLASYVVMDRSALTISQMASADRFILEIAAITGIALVAAECLNSLVDLRRVLRALTWGGAICGVIAVLQFWMSLDLSPYLRELPGFSLNFDNPGIIARAALNRVSGTAINPIELGVVAGMVLPLAIYLAIWDTERSPRRRWAPVVLIGLAIPTSVSRSAILAVVLALVVLVVLMPARQRVFAFVAMPFAVVVVFMSAPGLIGTLRSFFAAGTSDQSIATRIDDYPMVERMVGQAPWFGHGGGTYEFDNMVDILDNQFLKTAIEQGLFGVFALAMFFLVPVGAALIARRHTRDPELQLLCAALAGSGLAAAVCSLTFDSLSFPMFANVHALVIGMVGACWRLARVESTALEPISAPSVAAPVKRVVQPAGG
jgi:O-antigen ligase/polysaccharide polymerase Wzy-like membrane protein